MVGDNIRKFRNEADMTQEDLAHKSGLSQGYINQLESGKRRFTEKSLNMVAKALGISLERLFSASRAGSPKGLLKPRAVSAGARKKPNKREFLALLNNLPDHVVEHYLMLLRIETKIRKARKSG